MVDQARVEAFVVQVGVARGLISRDQLQAAQSRSGGSLLGRISPQLTAESRSVLQSLYHQALASERAGQLVAGPAPGEGSFSAEKTQAPGSRTGGFVGAETLVEGSPAAETYLGSHPGSASVASGGAPREKTESGRLLAQGETYAGGNVKIPTNRLNANETYASFVHEPTHTGGSEVVFQPAASEEPTLVQPPGSAPGAPIRETGPAASARTLALDEGKTASVRAATPLKPAGPAPQVGDRIGAYQTTRELGRGGMGIVYEARHVKTGDQVALKLMIVTRKTTEDDVERFKIEAKAALKLDHPNLVRVFEQGVSDEGHWFTAMELVSGEDLDAKMKREGILSSEEAVEIALDLADAIAYAHEQSILHRDIKPQNVMIDTEGVALLTDFGLAKLRDDDSNTSLTASGTLLGTPAYMSPEQATGEKREVDERTDVYCLGATIYHMLTGKPPFERPSLTSLLLAITSEKPLPPTQLVADVDRDLETIVLKCLEKERGSRYQSMRSLARDLNRWAKSLDIVATRPSQVQLFKAWAGANRPLVAVSVGAALVVLATLAFAFSRGPGQQVAESPTPAETPAKTEDPPAKTEDSPTKTEDPPTKTEEDPPTKTEDSPSKTEDPATKTEDPLETPRPALGKALPAAQPPTWLVRRLDHMRLKPTVLYISEWRDAVTEAGARQAPILLANLHHGVKGFTSAQLLADPAQVERVNASTVFVVAQFPHPPKPGETPATRSARGAPCPYFPMSCSDHERIQSRTVEPGWGEVQLRLYGSRGQKVLSETKNKKTGHQHNTIFDYTEAGFDEALAGARQQTGAILDPLDLKGAGQELSRADANSDRKSAEGVYASHAQRPGLLGSWARYRLRELCRTAIGKARGDAARLQALRPRFKADPGCLALIDAAR